jgi:hypothetical protein
MSDRTRFEITASVLWIVFMAFLTWQLIGIWQSIERIEKRTPPTELLTVKD